MGETRITLIATKRHEKSRKGKTRPRMEKMLRAKDAKGAKGSGRGESEVQRSVVVFLTRIGTMNPVH